jgi:hypothetical protein
MDGTKVKEGGSLNMCAYSTFLEWFEQLCFLLLPLTMDIGLQVLGPLNMVLNQQLFRGLPDL